MAPWGPLSDDIERQEAFRERRHLHVCDIGPWRVTLIYVKVKKAYVIRLGLLYLNIMSSMMSACLIDYEIWPFLHILWPWPSDYYGNGNELNQKLTHLAFVTNDLHQRKMVVERKWRMEITEIADYRRQRDQNIVTENLKLILRPSELYLLLKTGLGLFLLTLYTFQTINLIL